MACSPARVHNSMACLVADALKLGRGTYFPPLLEDLVAWSTLFRSADTWSNYCGYVRTGCLLCKASVEAHVMAPCSVGAMRCGRARGRQVFRHPAVRRAKASIRNFQNFDGRERLWVRRWPCTSTGVVVAALAWCAMQAEDQGAHWTSGTRHQSRALCGALPCDIRLPLEAPLGGSAHYRR